jgi:iron(III) transport system permease protein
LSAEATPAATRVVLDGRRRPFGRAIPRLALFGFIALLGYLVLVPLVRLQILAINHDGRGYREAFTQPGIWKAVRLTTWLAVGSLAMALVLGTTLAWAASSLPSRLRLLRILPVLPIVVPAISSVLGWTFMFSPHPGYLNTLLRHLPWWEHLYKGPVNVYSMTWIVIITGLQLTAFMYLFVSAGLSNINGELIEAAYACGSSRAGAFFRVVLPLLRPALVYGSGVSLLLGLGQFTAPLLLGRTAGIDVLTTRMYFATQRLPAQYDIAAAVGSPILIFGLVVLVLNRFLLADQARFVTHGGKGFQSEGRTSKLAAVGIVGYASVATLLPMIGLVIVALSPYWSGSVDPSTFTLENFHTVLHDPNILSAIRTSVVASLGAVAIALPIGYVIATVLLDRRTGRIEKALINFIVTVPVSIPAVIFGVAFLLTYTQGPFVLYGTRWVVILVYVTLMIPFTTRMQLSGMIALGRTYTEAARVSGAGMLRTNLTIIVPLMRSTFIGTASLMFILLMHEFAASLLVRASTIQVMGTILYDYYNGGGYPLVACISLLMVGITAVGVLLAIAVGGSEAFKGL